MKGIKCFLFFSVVLALGFAVAAPGIPHQFYGDVIVNGEAVDGNIIVAKVGNEYYRGISGDGSYGVAPGIFYVEDPNGNRAGELINFYLGGRFVGEIYEGGLLVGDASFITNGLTRLDIDTTTFCGDGYCVGNETCSVCEIDCGICTEPPVISIESPLDKIYETNKIRLSVSSDQDIFMWLYSLNGEGLVSFNSDILIPNLFINKTTGAGDNSVKVVGINNQGQSGSNIVNFRIELPSDFCGDNVCDAVESCESCPGDCGACSSGGGSSGGGSGSSGGGGSSNGIGLDSKEVVTFNYDSSKGDESGDYEDVTDYETSEEGASEGRFFSFMTGAVVGIGRTGIGIKISELNETRPSPFREYSHINIS